MKKMGNIIILFVLVMGYMAYGQDDCDHKQMIAKIDSISKSVNIENGLVQFNMVTSFGASTQTEGSALSEKQKFSFDGQFLVMGSGYFNMDKLLYFFIKEDYIVFFFQGY